jgi:predicted phosphodiesterase
MQYGVLADVHSNLEALRAVLSFFGSKKIDHYLCLGDIVGYGPNPNECVSVIKALPHCAKVAGNHDRAACGLKVLLWFNEYARKAVLWTARTLTQDNQIFLSELPKSLSHEGLSIVHGSPRDPLDEYLLTREQYKENLPLLTENVTFVGHSHIPFAFSRTSAYSLRDHVPLLLLPEEKYIINPGPVGQPRDEDNKASCGIYDDYAGEFRLYRLEYDYTETQRKMRQHRLPAFLMERLAWGR